MRAGNIHVVSGDKDRETRGLHELRERPEDMVGSLGVEISRGLVSQENARRIGDRARDGDALLLAARKFGRPMGQAVLETEIGQKIGGALGRFARDKPRTICGMITFSSAENSISR